MAQRCAKSAGAHARLTADFSGVQQLRPSRPSHRKAEAFGSHLDGAVALLKMRGKEIFSTIVGRKLFLMLRSLLVSHLSTGTEHPPWPSRQPRTIDTSRLTSPLPGLEKSLLRHASRSRAVQAHRRARAGRHPATLRRAVAPRSRPPSHRGATAGRLEPSTSQQRNDADARVDSRSDARG